MTKGLPILIIFLTLSAISVQAEDYSNMEPLRLEKPEMHASLADIRTQHAVKTYKVKDDITLVGVPVFVAGIIGKNEKKTFPQQCLSPYGNRIQANSKSHFDNYTQYFGPAMTLGLKLSGVEGRSDWPRFLASAAMSYGIMAGMTKAIKSTAHEMRPDGSTRDSWPSGHTAISFAGATILHKEYGMTRSPWYSVAGYGVAAATGMMRVINNRHWGSDVLSGAGIGIMSTEIAYALSDVLFKEKGLLRSDMEYTTGSAVCPSFLSVSLGMGFGLRELDFKTSDASAPVKVKFQTATVVQAEGAYFFNKNVGVGGRLRVSTSPMKGCERAEADILAANSDLSVESNHLAEFAADAGLYFNIPLAQRFSLGTKCLVGRSMMQSLDINGHYAVNAMGITGTANTNGMEYDLLTVSAKNTSKFGTGVALTYGYKGNISWKVFCDYDYTRKDYTLTCTPLYTENHTLRKHQNTWVLGASFAVML